MYKERLKEYIEQDTIYQDWCDKNLSYVSDFDRFCIEHCQDIKNLLNEAEELHNKIEKAIEYMEHYIKVEERKYNDNVMKEFEFVIKLLKGGGVDE